MLGGKTSFREELTMFFFYLLFALFPFSYPKKGGTLSPIGMKQRGFASWYAETGHLGKRFVKEHRFTAAHRTLPFGTYVEVQNLKNQKKVLVCIDDRGPFVRGRIIDLSKPAAEKLQMVDAGIVPVELKVVKYSSY
ncbi:Lipoprotein [Methylacidiphilum infernorum V4]|uniref:Probable endolytic peptidoglycan transglycosylase RlpA n=2 Tax=Candidatus Methylacidiphilum infernorum TaxID=511746 RepID=B3DUY9_METI4|nr:Lipoprotein [Methylacidiphilum infernorum V4]